MNFKLQSINDVVTNSSMEVYVQATDYTISAIQQIIDTVLRMGGSNKSCDDLFDIKIDYDDMLWKYFEYYVDGELDSDERSEEFKTKLQDTLEATSGRKADGDYWSSKEMYEMLEDSGLIGPNGLRTIKEYTKDCDYGWDHHVSTSVIITPKCPSTDKDIAILNSINSLFNLDASYDS